MVGRIFRNNDRHLEESADREDWQSNASISRTGGFFIRCRVLREHQTSLLYWRRIWSTSSDPKYTATCFTSWLSEEDTEETKYQVSTRRMRYLSMCREQLRKRWQNEYLKTLQERYKNQKTLNKRYQALETLYWLQLRTIQSQSGI